MIIYEVNLSIENSVYKEFYTWLIEHVKTMLNFDGFLSGTIAQEKDQSERYKTNITVHYQIESEEKLTDYLQHHAPHMRAQGLNKFGEAFSSTRRILITPLRIEKQI